MNIDRKDIEQYLSEVKEAVEKDNYRLERNAGRQDNISLFLDYIIKTVSLYIKFNKLESCFVIVISFHEQKYPLRYYFR